MSRISTCFFLKKKGKKPTKQNHTHTRADWFPIISLFSYFVLSSEMLLSPDKLLLDWCLCEDIPLDCRTKEESTKAAFSTSWVISWGSWGHDTIIVSFVLAQGNPCYIPPTKKKKKKSQFRICNHKRKKQNFYKPVMERIRKLKEAIHLQNFSKSSPIGSLITLSGQSGYDRFL